MQEREAATAPLKDLFEEREKLKKEMYIHTTKQAELQSELASKQMAFRAYVSRQKQARWEADKIERQRNALKAEKEDLQNQLDNADDTFMNPKMISIKRMIMYLKKEVEKYENSIKSEAAIDDQSENVTSETSVPEGFQELVHEDDADIDELKRERAKGKKGKKQKSKLPERLISDVVNHPLDVLATLVTLNVEYPKRICDCSATITQLETQFNTLNSANEAVLNAAIKKKQDLKNRILDVETKIKEFDILNPPKTTGKKKTDEKTEVTASH